MSLIHLVHLKWGKTVLLYHYYERIKGPFQNLSSLSLIEATRILNEIKQEGVTFASQRDSNYLKIRRELEKKAREMFVSKGGKPASEYPHYLTMGSCPWLKSWYKQGEEIVINLDDLQVETISFTYGDLFPTMRHHDGKPYRQTIYTLFEIKDIIAEFGLPQHWNADGSKGPERYIEVQLWDNDILNSLCERSKPSYGN